MTPDAIRRLSDEVEGQASVLERFSLTKLPKARRGAIFVGAGDSYAAALAAFYATGGGCVALDPYVLASSPGFADGSEVYFVSVSGRTSSNVMAAEKVRHHASRTTAITAAADSRLAELTGRAIELPMSYAPRTSGMLSFCLSLLAVLKLVGEDGPCDFRIMLEQARKADLGFSKEGTTYFLGNSLAYPVALYAAAKTYEILGAKAHAELLEEFSHLELFALEKKDFVNGFASFDSSGLSTKLGRALARGGHRSRVVESRGRNAVEELFHAVFVVQLSVLEAASQRGLTAPRFLSSRSAIATSDAMIY